MLSISMFHRGIESGPTSDHVSPRALSTYYHFATIPSKVLRIRPYRLEREDEITHAQIRITSRFRRRRREKTEYSQAVLRDDDYDIALGS
jgi:hypothetical protein